MAQDSGNAENLHGVGQDKATKVKGAWVNPGTPDAPLVSMSDMTSATVKGGQTAKLKEGIIK